MANIREAEILHINDLGKPDAVSYDPGAFSEETIRTIINNQITSPTPLEIHCYRRDRWRLGFKTIEAFQFAQARNQTEEERKNFVEKSTALIKNIDTYDIIFSEPLKPKR